MSDDADTPPELDTMQRIMQAKLAHAQAVLEGLALTDFLQIETNALALKEISQSSAWRAQESVAYFDFSDQFRKVCDDLAYHARKKDLDQLVTDYGNLTNSCVACHTYLRMERQIKDIPGRVSMIRSPHVDNCLQ